MAFEEPAKARFTIEEDAEGLVITIPSRKQLFLVLFVGVWLCMWAIGEFFVIRMLLGALLGGEASWEKDSGPFGVGILIFILAWLVIWTAVGAFAMYAWLWNVAGRQVVCLGATGLQIENIVPIWRRGREYRLTDVQALRVSVEQVSPWSVEGGIRFWGIGGGPLAFDYGAKTVRFGAGLDEAEAKMIHAAIAERRPDICQSVPSEK